MIRIFNYLAATALIIVMLAGIANALGVSSVWRGMVYSSSARQYGTVQIIDETGQVVKTLTLKPFANHSGTTAFVNWSTSPTPGAYILYYNLSSVNGKISYTRTLQVDAPTSVSVDAKSMWNFTGIGGRTLTQSVGVNPATLWNYTGARARKLDNLDAPVSGIAASVWNYGARTLTSFGTIVADAASAVWGAVTRTVTGGMVTASNAPSAADIDTRLSSTHPGNWAATGSGGGFGNTTGLGDYFAGRFGNGPWGGSTGDGNTIVDETFGAAQGNPMPLLATVNGVPTGGVRIRAYLASDYSAEIFTSVKASTVSLDNGKWANKLHLSHGVAYTLEFTYAGRSVTASITP